MASYLPRRKFLATLGGAAAVAWPLAARAQQGERVRRIGLLMGVADDREGQARVTALKQGLQELGWTDGRNIQIETRFGGGDAGRIRAHAAELVALAPDVIIPKRAHQKTEKSCVAPHTKSVAGHGLRAGANRSNVRMTDIQSVGCEMGIVGV